MQVTKIIQAKRKQERAHIYLDGKFAAAVNKNIIAEFGLFVGKEIDEGIWEKIKYQEVEQRLFTKLYELWMRRPRSRMELVRKVKEIEHKQQGSIDHEIINRVLTRLESIGLTDSAFAAWWVGQRQTSGKIGKLRIEQELKGHGIAKQTMLEAFGQLPQTDEAAQQEGILQKKFGVSALKELKDPREKSRAFRFLTSRGFRPKL